MSRWKILAFVRVIVGAGGEAIGTPVPLDSEVLRAAAEVNYRLPATVPSDILARAASMRPAAASPKAMAPWPTDGWTTSTPEDQGMSTTTLTAAFRYAFAHGARSVAVFRNAYLVGEHYGPGWDASTRQQAYSVSKSFTSSLLGMLMDDGVITGTDQAVADFIPQWDDPQHGAVTIGHLLSMDSGLEYGLLTDPLLVVSRNQNDYAIGLPMQHEPGTKWVYHNAACQVPSEIILNASGRQASRFAWRFLIPGAAWCRRCCRGPPWGQGSTAWPGTAAIGPAAGPHREAISTGSRGSARSAPVGWSWWNDGHGQLISRGQQPAPRCVGSSVVLPDSSL
ncbi:beta-lactamase family protein [bacterium]|nr:beta-lactamase family protein [bacterium]